MSTTFTVTSESFEQDVLNSDLPVLVDFWADWCGPCKSLAPLLETIAEDYDGRLRVAKVNVDEEQQIAGAAGIRSLPTMMLFIDGRPVEQIVGAQPDANIRAVIDQFIDEGDDAPAQPPELEPGNPQQARAKLEAVLDDDPGNAAAINALAKILIVEGKLQEAESLLGKLSEEDAKSPEAAQNQAAVWFAAKALEITAPEADLQQANSSEERYAVGIQAAAGGNHDLAAEVLLELMKSDRKFGDDAARIALIKLTELLGQEDPRVGALRRQMMSLIY
ncbi:MAG: thioredoxin [Pseudomonadota bacterium]